MKVTFRLKLIGFHIHNQLKSVIHVHVIILLEFILCAAVNFFFFGGGILKKYLESRQGGVGVYYKNLVGTIFAGKILFFKVIIARYINMSR